MKKPVFLRAFALAGMAFFFAALPLKADGFSDRLTWSFQGSVLMFPEDNGNRGGPMPVLPAPGAALACSVWGPLSVELSLDMYFTNYKYDFEWDRALPAEIENRSAFVFGFLTGLCALARFSPADNLMLRAYGGPGMDMRIITLALDLHPDDFSGLPETDAQIQTDAVREYFWGQGRWFLPVAGVGIDYGVNEKFLIGLDFRTWFPLYRTWSGEDLPPIEGWRFGVGLRITLR
ncbi:MAG: hypothetical protein LBG10_04115 [Treponema sp.]|jgi:hypothetical protein|nr:hypothetical protein [Treponema sp.]